MKRFTLMIKWFFAFTKRLLVKPSFCVALLIIPAVVILSYFASNEESGLATIAVACEDGSSSVYNSIVKELCSESEAIVYKEYDSRDEAVQAIADGVCAYAWVFKENLDEKMALYAAGDDVILCEIISKEETMMTKVTSEKLYSVIYKHLSKELFLDFMREKSIDHENANDEYLSQYFDEYKANVLPDIIKFSFLGDANKKIEDANYITSPLKGLLAACMLICCLAAMMYSLDDERAGKYAMFAVSSRFFLHFTAVLASGILVSAVIYISMLISGGFKHPFYDAVSLLMYALMSTAFCVLLGTVFRSSKVLCIFLPVLVVLTVSLCPVFVNIKGFEPIKNILPAYHYLKSVPDGIRLCHMSVYFALLFVFDYLLYKLLSRKM